ncbi:hypothetical protein AGMMS49525_15050 [Bacteroidia bacterium]|nr:hypothetical protein AGMMS49525_15050 [Bacteroidia bacterium]
MILCLFANVFAYNQQQKLTNRNTAIIFAATTTIKSAPDNSGTDLFILHEGTKVKITNQLGDWREVETADGNIGFTKSVGLGGVTDASKTPNGQYAAATPITAAAVASTNYVFSYWTATGVPAGFDVNNAASQTFNMPTSAVTLKANFTRVYAFSKSASAGGSVSGTGNGNLQANASVSVTATPSSGYAFKNWTVVGTAPAGFDVNASTQTFAMPESALTLKANFVQTYAFSTVAGPGGIVYTTSANASLVAGTVITVAAIPNNGYVFTNWTVVTGTLPAGFDVNKRINQTFTMPTVGLRLKANFSPL